MILPDINLLIYAYRAETKFHDIALKKLEQISNQKTPIALSSIITSGFLRIVTNPRIYSKPSDIEHAISFINFITTFPHFKWIEPGSEHWQIYLQLLNESRFSGAKVSDVLIASIAAEHGYLISTFDRDFLRFDNVRVEILK